MLNCIWSRPFGRAVPIGLGVVLAAALVSVAPLALAQERDRVSSAEFPSDLVEWTSVAANPVFTAGGEGSWDRKIRERGWVLYDRGLYRLWYTGYDGTREGVKLLGYATSRDGVAWTRAGANPLCSDRWIEDMMVVKCDGLYYMFAEGAEDGHAELLTSADGVAWSWRGKLDIRLADGRGNAAKPCGTPTAWVENGVWRLFYERHDRGVWLATTTDPLSCVWTNVDDDPVLVPGPDDHDKLMIALDQIVKQDGVYYAFYHGCGNETPRTWNTNIARSTDLVHWEKFAGNPIIRNKSSGIVVGDGLSRRLYTMHDQVDVFVPRGKPKASATRP